MSENPYRPPDLDYRDTTSHAPKGTVVGPLWHWLLILALSLFPLAAVLAGLFITGAALFFFTSYDFDAEFGTADYDFLLPVAAFVYYCVSFVATFKLGVWIMCRTASPKRPN